MYWRVDATSSWLATFDELFPERVPDMLEQFGIARRLAHLYRIARPRKVNHEHILDHAGPRRKQNDTIRQRQGFAKVMRHEQNRLLFALPDSEQDVVHIDLGVGIERTERFVHQQNLRLDDQRSHQRSALTHSTRQGRGVSLFEALKASLRHTGRNAF